MQFTPAELPSGIDTVEKLLVWAVQVLASKQYSPIEISNTSGPMSPVFERVSRAPSGPNYSKPYLEFGGFVPLDNEAYPTAAAYAAAEPFEATDSIPARFQ